MPRPISSNLWTMLEACRTSFGSRTYFTRDGVFDTSSLFPDTIEFLQERFDGDFSRLTRRSVQAWSATYLLNFHKRDVRKCLTVVSGTETVNIREWYLSQNKLLALWAGAARCEWELALEQGVSLVVATRAYVRTRHAGERLIACPDCPHNVVSLKRIRTSKGFQRRVEQVFRAKRRNC